MQTSSQFLKTLVWKNTHTHTHTHVTLVQV